MTKEREFGSSAMRISPGGSVLSKTSKNDVLVFDEDVVIFEN